MPRPTVATALLVLALASSALPVRAQTQSEEAPDPTRLDVERLPPEAVDVTRDMFEAGPFVLAELGGRGFAGGLGRVADAGVLGRVGVGYELAVWLVVAASVELSLHETASPAPPAPSSFQLIDGIAEVRLRLPLSERAALWLGGEGGLGWVPGNLLPVLGIPDSESISLIYGGSLGFDWHLLSKHHVLGLRAGGRLYPGLEGADPTVGIHSAVSLAYVF